MERKFFDVMGEKRFKGRLDAMIVCHGLNSPGTVRDTNLKDYDQIMNINVRSTFMVVSLAVPFLQYSKGNVVIMTGTAGTVPSVGESIYSISRAMVNMFIQCAALELASFGVRVNGVARNTFRKRLPTLEKANKKGGMEEVKRERMEEERQEHEYMNARYMPLEE